MYTETLNPKSYTAPVHLERRTLEMPKGISQDPCLESGRQAKVLGSHKLRGPGCKDFWFTS